MSNYEFQITNYVLRMSNYELRVNYEFQITNYGLGEWQDAKKRKEERRGINCELRELRIT